MNINTISIQYIVILGSVLCLLFNNYLSIYHSVNIPYLYIGLLVIGGWFFYKKVDFWGALFFIVILSVSDFHYDVAFDGILYIPKTQFGKVIPWFVIILAKLIVFALATLSLTLYHRLVSKSRFPRLNWKPPFFISVVLVLIVHIFIIPMALLNDPNTFDQGAYIIYGILMLLAGISINLFYSIRGKQAEVKYNLGTLLFAPVAFFQLSLYFYY